MSSKIPSLGPDLTAEEFQPGLSNAEIADRLASLAQLLSTQKENPYKIKAYSRAAAKVRNVGDSLEQLVHEEADLTQFAGIGDAIAAAIREIVLTGTLRKLETLRSEASPEVASLSEFPLLDPRQVKRAYKKLNISSIDELRDSLTNGELEKRLGQRLAQHVRKGLLKSNAMLLYHADDVRRNVEEYLLGRCRATRVEAVGVYRRRHEVVDELSFVVQTNDPDILIKQFQRYGGRTPLLSRRRRHGRDEALYSLSSGISLRIQTAGAQDWGFHVAVCTGSDTHVSQLAERWGGLRVLASLRLTCPDEVQLYEEAQLQYVPPELREGRDEIGRAAARKLPQLVRTTDIRGELHAHSTSSDGSSSIEDMAEAARRRGYEYLGITDHSQSLKLARGVSVEDLWAQIRYIERLNEGMSGFRILKSAEVDILADGSLDYPDELLRELDYTICSIHSRFGLNRDEQTGRLLRAMDNRNFTILGHPHGRLLLKRPGYELDMERVIKHARETGSFFEINSSPDRLDLSADDAGLAAVQGVKIAISTDAHSIRDYDYVRYGIDQARRAGLTAADILNTLPLTELLKHFER